MKPNLLRVGINPLSWTNDAYHNLGDDIPFSTCIRDAAAAGFTGMEIGRKFPRDPKVMLEALAGHGLLPVSCWYSGFLTERDIETEWAEAEPFVNWLKDLGATCLIYGECGAGAEAGQDAKLNQNPPLSNIDFEQYAARLTEFGDRCAKLGMPMVYHHHIMHPIETEKEIDLLMTATGPSVGLLLDTGHLAMIGADYRQVAEKWWHRIGHLHLKDVRQSILTSVDRSKQSLYDTVLEGVFTLPGDGDLDFAPLFEKIAKDGYAGWIVVEAEQDPQLAPPGPLSKKCFTYLDDQIQAAGLSCKRNIYRG